MFILTLSQFGLWSFRSWSLRSGHYAIQSHSRSPISVPIKSPYVTSY